MKILVRFGYQLTRFFKLARIELALAFFQQISRSNFGCARFDHFAIGVAER